MVTFGQNMITHMINKLTQTPFPLPNQRKDAESFPKEKLDFSSKYN